MRASGPYLGSRRGCSAVTVIGWLVFVVAGIVLVWFGFFRSPSQVRETPVVQSTGIPEPTATTESAAVATLPATATSQPTVTPMPTDGPPSPTAAAPSVVTGADGANVRSGSGINYTKIGYLDAGAEVPVTGRHAGWWQIDYNGVPGWVYGEIVTAHNTGDVPEVSPPLAPTSPPPPATATIPPEATATPSEPTATPGPQVFNGLAANSYSVELAPGPYSAGSDIWFNMDITNISGGQVDYEALGTWVQESEQFQKSWTNQNFAAGQHFMWRDHLAISGGGTYHLWMRICFTHSNCVNMLGPVEVQVQ